jgi:hypothetical protein
MKNGGWLDSYADGGSMQEHQENYNDNSVSLPEGYVGEGYDTKGRDYSPAWGGQFQMGGSVYPVNYVPQAQMGGSIPGAVGFSYARTNNPAPSNGPYAKKTMASAKSGKVIKDDRGQWAHPGEITEIDSPYITMQGVPYPVLGISDTGDTQMMYPEEEYKFKGKKVTEFPIAQDGNKVDNANFNNEVDKSLEYFKNWQASPMYKQMLKNSTKSDWFDYGYEEDRNKQLQTLIKNKKTLIRRPNEEYGTKGESAHANPNTGVLNFYKSTMPYEYSGTIPHEISHATDASIPGFFYNSSDRLIPSDDIELIKKYTPASYKDTAMYKRLDSKSKANVKNLNLMSDEKIKYFTTPTETRARLNVIRKFAKENKIYDPFTEKIDKNKFKELFNNKDILPQEALDLNSIYDETQMIHLLNTISENQDSIENFEDKKYPLAKDGKELVKLNQLTNFTNYNTKQPGGWMDKYQ